MPDIFMPEVTNEDECVRYEKFKILLSLFYEKRRPIICAFGVSDYMHGGLL